jgi:hypothetical protein
VEALAKRVKGIRAFHGSPHDFDQFSLDKIGTGEGAQAYGHGLYFAENEGVAQSYRALAEPSYRGNVPRSIAGAAMDRAKQAGLDGADAKKAALAELNEMMLASKDDWRRGQIRDAINNFEAVTSPSQAGRMYEVNIHADPEDFLDWDAPLSQQPKVAEKLKGVAPEVVPTKLLNGKVGLARLQSDGSAKNIYGIEGDSVDEVMRQWTGERLHATLDTASRIDGAGRAQVGGAMREAGIPGIKYLDGGSRTAGQGTRNYVVFDDKLISIVKKYGILGALNAGLINQAQAKELAAQGYGN